MDAIRSRLFQPASLTGSVGAQAGALVVGRGIGYVRGVLLAWLMSQHEFGVFQLAAAVVNLLVPLGSLGLTHGVLRYAPAHEARRTLGAFSRRAAGLTLAVAAVLAGLLAAAPARVGDFLFAAGLSAGSPAADSATGAPAWLAAVAALCTFCLIAFHLVVDLMKGLRLFRAASLMEVLGVVLFSSLAVVAPLAGFDSANTVLLVYGLGNAATLVLFVPPLVGYVRSQPSDADSTRDVPLVDTRLMRYSVWMAASQVAWHGLQQYVLWHLAKVGDYRLVATYFAIRLFAQLVLLGGQTWIRALSANVTRVWEAKGRAASLVRLEAGAKVGALAVMSAAVLLSWLKPWILLAFPPDYAVGAESFEPLLLAYAWFAMLECLWIRFHLEETSVFTFWTSLVGALTNVVLAVWILGVPPVAATTDATAMLARASWVCVAGSGSAVLASLLVLIVTGKRPGAATMLLTVAMAAVGGGRVVSLVVLLLLLACSLPPIGLFTSSERRIVAAWRQGQ